MNDNSDKPDQFDIGATVVLMSGGHEMTVEKIDGSDLHCVWSDGRQIKNRIFRRELVRDSKRKHSVKIHRMASDMDIDDAATELSSLPTDEMTHERFREILRQRFGAK
jgi:uncharacterized protein YodC (DUF2158 family)